MKIKCMLIKNGYPKAHLDRCIMKYLSKKHEASINSLTKKTPEGNFVGSPQRDVKTCIPLCRRGISVSFHALI